MRFSDAGTVIERHGAVVEMCELANDRFIGAVEFYNQ
jgi:hypothetical protein